DASVATAKKAPRKYSAMRRMASARQLMIASSPKSAPNRRAGWLAPNSTPAMTGNTYRRIGAANTAAPALPGSERPNRSAMTGPTAKSTTNALTNASTVVHAPGDADVPSQMAKTRTVASAPTAWGHSSCAAADSASRPAATMKRNPNSNSGFAAYAGIAAR